MASEEYRRLAEDCKQLISKKDRVIKIYQEKIDEGDNHVKLIEHELIKVNALLNLLLEIWTKKNEIVIIRNMCGIFCKMEKLIGNGRDILSYHEDEDDMLAEFDLLGLDLN